MVSALATQPNGVDNSKERRQLGRFHQTIISPPALNGVYRVYLGLWLEGEGALAATKTLFTKSSPTLTSLSNCYKVGKREPILLVWKGKPEMVTGWKGLFRRRKSFIKITSILVSLHLLVIQTSFIAVAVI